MTFKHSLLALGAAAALGAAGSAHALTYFGYYSTTSASEKATGLEVRDGGHGDMLVVPYFNAQGKTQTALHVTNQDEYGKALRVHVRGAANGDILKSFTVLLGKNDTWTFTINPAAGAAPKLHSGHPACVFTDSNGATGELNESLELGNLAPYISQANKIKHAGEGYIEIITMAEVGPSSATMNDINSRNCGALNALVRDFAPFDDEAAAKAAELREPEGALSGLWYLINQDTWTAYSGRMTAIRATDGNGSELKRAQIRFFPQRNAAETAAGGDTNEQTGLAAAEAFGGDILGGIGAGGWSAVPNLAQQLMVALSAEEQITAIGKAMKPKKDIVNDFASTPSGAVPMFTDWVVSNPLQRYYARVDYGASPAQAKVVKVDFGSATRYGADGSIMKDTGMGPALCQNATLHVRDRAGKIAQTKNLEACGAVWTLGFAAQSPMAASVGRIVQAAPAEAGWARLTYASQQPVALGFAAFSAKNKDTGISYPTTWPHAQN